MTFYLKNKPGELFTRGTDARTWKRLLTKANQQYVRVHVNATADDVKKVQRETVERVDNDKGQ